MATLTHNHRVVLTLTIKTTSPDKYAALGDLLRNSLTNNDHAKPEINELLVEKPTATRVSLDSSS